VFLVATNFAMIDAAINTWVSRFHVFDFLRNKTDTVLLVGSDGDPLTVQTWALRLETSRRV
jgi:hypothetical protein